MSIEDSLLSLRRSSIQFAQALDRLEQRHKRFVAVEEDVEKLCELVEMRTALDQAKTILWAASSAASLLGGKITVMSARKGEVI